MNDTNSWLFLSLSNYVMIYSDLKRNTLCNNKCIRLTSTVDIYFLI